jgi:hypothetical protein
LAHILVCPLGNVHGSDELQPWHLDNSLRRGEMVHTQTLHRHLENGGVVLQGVMYVLVLQLLPSDKLSLTVSIMIVAGTTV